MSTTTPTFRYQEMFPHAHPVDTPWRKLDIGGISTGDYKGHRVLEIAPQTLTELARVAMADINHLYRPGHLQQLADILDDDEASKNDHFVAHALLKNAVVSVAGVLPSCQDTGTAIVLGKKGQWVFTSGDDAEALSRGIFRTYTEDNLRYSQLAPFSAFEEKNTGTNLPAQIDLLHVPDGDSYDFLFIAKGGGSANKTYLFQETKTLLNPQSMRDFIRATLPTLGTAACPPYHLAVVIGGTSAEMNLKTVKLASCRYLDDLPTHGNELGHAIRDLDLEQEILQITRDLGIGAQFGGKYFCHDVRVVRLPRHGASCPVGIGVSCSADRQIKAKITADGVFLEALETDPARFMPELHHEDLSDDVVKIDLNRPMDQILAELTRYPIKTRLALSGPMIVARDIAHAKLKERLDKGQGLPDYALKYAVYYAGPAKTPPGMPSGSFGPTTASRMDPYVDLFQSHGASMVMIAKGNRSKSVTEACQKHGGFYLGSIGGQAAVLAAENITKIEVLDYADLGMEAVWKIEVVDFPAFVIVDDKGNDFFA
ncbi:MAG: fumarate hydratase [Oligoflexia bacterium]|nr:fumarate hydratase [Oligoflexia bacterium]